MTTVREHHDRAMLFAERLLTARQHEASAEELQSLALSAYEAELNAALLAFERDTSAATRLILLRSAAHLAREAKQWESGLDLALRALGASDLRLYRTELLHILDTLRTYEHLQVEGVSLSDTDIQLSVAGPEAAPGFARADEVVRRVNDLRKLMVRSTMRRAGLAFDAPPLRGRTFRDSFTPYLSIPRAASYAVTVRFGYQQQIPLDLELAEDLKAPRVEDAIDDLMRAAKQYASGGAAALRELIPDERYARATASLLHDLAPDSKRIQTVGLTVVRNGIQDAIALPTRRILHPVPVGGLTSLAKKGGQQPEEIEVLGTLLEGSAKRPRKAWATIVQDDDIETIVQYDEATHGDVIDGYWKHRVRARMMRIGKHQWVLTDIQDA